MGLKSESLVSSKGRPCVGLDDQLAELNEFCLPARFPKMFFAKRRQAHGMMLCGLSGTGKTYSVQTIMARLRNENVVTSHIDLKRARRQSIDALSQRLSALERIVNHQVIGVFLFVDNLHCLQGSLAVEDMLYRFLKINIDGEHNGCIVVGATTNPRVISTRMKSFFERKVSYDLPNNSARRRTCEGYLSWARIKLTPKWIELLNKLERETRLWNYCELVLVFKLAMLRRSSVQPRFAKVETSTAYPKLRVEDVEYVLDNNRQIIGNTSEGVQRTPEG